MSSKSPLIESSLIEYEGSPEDNNLGKGGFGVVRLGKLDGQAVAVKSLFLNNEDVDPLGAAELFLSEAKNMRELEHSRIVKFIGFIMESFSIVMELMPEGTLEDYILKNKKIDLAWPIRYQLSVDIADGMAYLHSKKTPDGKKKRDLFHQDLKSANVLLCFEKGVLRGKISDFGLSVIRDKATGGGGGGGAGPSEMVSSSANNTNKSFVVHVGGTRTYMAPELQQTSKFTKECDVYAYGVILLEIATLLDPVEAITDFRVHLDRYMIPKILKQLIFGCLSLDPIKRPSFDVASSQLRSNEKLIASFEGGAPLPDYEEESYILDDGDAKKKGKDGKGSRSLLSGFYDSNLVSRFTANSGRFGDTKAPRKSNNEGAGGEYVSNYNRDFDFTGKKKKRKKIVIAILVGLLILLIIGLGVGLKYLLASAASASTTSTSFDGGSSVSYNSISTVTPTTLKSRSSSTTTTSTTKIPLPAETLPLLLPNATIPDWSDNITHFGGVNSFFLHALDPYDIDDILDNLQKAYVKVVRIYILATQEYSKKSSAIFVPDVEPITPGVYNDTILELMDVLMYKAHNRSMKLIIAMHDRYALGCWNTDAYVAQYNLPTVIACGSSYNYPLRFYHDPPVIAMYDNRLKHVLTHKNPYFSNRTWGSIGEAIYAFDIENSAEANFPSSFVRNASWLCGRAQNMKPYLSNGILIASGGAEDYAHSLYEPIFQCPYIDIVSIRDGSNAPDYIATNLDLALSLGAKYSKTVVMESFCAPDGSKKAQTLAPMITACNQRNISWLVWEVMNPGNNKDCEFYTDDTLMWDLLAKASRDALLGVYQNATYVDTNLGDWDFCTVSAQCANRCCSNQYSNDGKLKCTVGGTICV